MFAFFAENLAPIMFLSLIVVLLIGYPVAFALAFVGFVFGFIGIEMGLLPASLFGAIPDRIFGQMSNETSEAEWRRIFSTRSASSSARCAAVSPSL
jgi:TRAP-type mannitol/chloroaromatic compound transport system permease large subunit